MTEASAFLYPTRSLKSLVVHQNALWWHRYSNPTNRHRYLLSNRSPLFLCLQRRSCSESSTNPYVAAPLPQDETPVWACSEADMSCSDLLSLRSDSVSVSGSRRSDWSQEDDTRSFTTSSVMSLMQRVQLGPLEKDWIRSCASGNTSAQRILLHQDPSLIHKKRCKVWGVWGDFISLHWATKLGLQETVELMIRSGADVNTRSGYTALHLASIHGHRHIALALVNLYNAKTNIRDYHGKMAAHYWNGSTEIFQKPHSQTVAVFSQRRRTQRYTLPSLLLSRSRSQELFHLEFSLRHSASQEAMESYV
ncbi:hypothetical protein WMY93_023727 [Mugilogobius chulae]|uniref:Ankyrin repeat domain-containing protein SOWAHC-like n=1 Tax=Mugilogobius chulae TaxID=88201 RepID=A0AAW0N522_9GOBI